MGILQKVFDVNARIVENIYDIADARNSRAAQTAVELTAIPFGLACEATALAAKVRKKPVDTRNTYISGKFF